MNRSFRSDSNDNLSNNDSHDEGTVQERAIQGSHSSKKALKDL